ncbi:DEAD/DEAH box helicase [Prevotella melaninogenica]|uniref:DEAD/DEAH box helicase n=1 Tax=Prevotella melaninogenica TaxID=28132 RepID=UPI001C5EF4B3|nr:DEAD/DEAH box helicase [Prevotella melaninogenica]MBW4742248.1 DEAD/DEAH box helicase [Prevotella melaninogenica]MBW4913060.1 DEAD/DEAH box helicase [Prevotella melaninogenica]
MKREELRNILRNEFSADTDRFQIIKEVEIFVVTEQSVGQEFVLRLLARIEDFQGMETLIQSLVRQVGLFPYLKEEILSLKDTIAYEVHRPSGFKENIVFHHAQAEVYYTLLRGENVVLSAPTSFGKSLIIDSIIASQKHSNIFIIVPTIALIDETRKRLSKFKDSYKIITHPSQSFSQRNIFILTQERAIEIIPNVNVDFFIIDEFYKLSPQKTDEERCHILNQVFYMLVKKDAQFYLLGPNIEQVTTSLLDNVKFKFIKTDYKTVVSERHPINLKNGEDPIERLIELSSSLEDSTLIFCQSPASANKVAKAFCDSNKFEKTDENKDLVDWLRDNYHSQWILPDCLEYGIGIHHGKIPRAIAQKCIKLFNEGKIRFLICTSTLIEGVNTKAKSVIVYDNKIARTKFDYFTFNNICGRSGRMGSYFIGHIYLFHEPPAPELPLVDFPIFTQTDDAPEKLLINVDVADLNESSKRKLKKYFEQDVLSQETLKKNSYIDLDRQLDLANFIQGKLKEIHDLMKWEKYPTNNQLKLSCMLIWDYFVSSNKRIYGVSSGQQLHFRLNQFREARNIKNFITAIIDAEEAKTIDSINCAIELAFDIQRHWINFQFPRYLMSLGDIANDIFRKNNLPLCDYSYFASLVECYFMAPYVIPMDEYGLPIPISKKIGDIIEISSNMDDALKQLSNFSPMQEQFSSIECEFIEEFKEYI